MQRRVNLLAEEGITFINNAEVGKNVDAQQLLQDNDAVLLAVGSTCPRNIPLPGMFLLILKQLRHDLRVLKRLASTYQVGCL